MISYYRVSTEFQIITPLIYLFFKVTGFVEVDDCDADGGDHDDNDNDFACLALEIELDEL